MNRILRWGLLLCCCLVQASCVIATTGDWLDSVGRVRPHLAEPTETSPVPPRCYAYAGAWYMPAKVEFYEEAVHPLAKISAPGGTVHYPERRRRLVDEEIWYFRLNAAEVEAMAERTVPEPPESAPLAVSAKDFPENAAVMDAPYAPLYAWMPVQRYGARSYSLSYTLEDIEWLPIPTRRTWGNYLRTPLAALMTYGVDIPASVAASSVVWLGIGINGLVVSVADTFLSITETFRQQQ